MGHFTLLGLLALQLTISVAAALNIQPPIVLNVSSAAVVPSNLTAEDLSLQSQMGPESISYVSDANATPAGLQRQWERFWRHINQRFLPALQNITDAGVSRNTLYKIAWTIEINFRGDIQSISTRSAYAWNKDKPDVTWLLTDELVGETRRVFQPLQQGLPAANELYSWDDVYEIKVYPHDATNMWREFMEKHDIKYRGRPQFMELVSLKYMPDVSTNKQYFWRFQYQNIEFFVGTQYGQWVHVMNSS